MISMNYVVANEFKWVQNNGFKIMGQYFSPGQLYFIEFTKKKELYYLVASNHTKTRI